MSRRRRNAFLLLVAVQALVPLAMIAANEVALARGTEVRLRTVPVDPIDLFRGRYVTLRYEISSLPVEGGARRGQTVWVPLSERGGVWTGSVARPSRPDGGTFIRGRVRSAAGDRAEIEYGIETYYADEEEAQRLEREAGRRLHVDVVLDADGGARVAGIELVR